MYRGLMCVAVSVLLAGCEVLENFETPTITDTSEQWMSGDARILTAEIDVPAGYEIVTVHARYARHHWPGPADAHEVVAQPSNASGTVWRATPPLAQTAWQADHLFYEWFIDYRLPDGNEVATVRTGRRDFVIGCSDNSINASIDTLAAFIRAFDDLDNGIALGVQGYLAIPHGNTSLAQIGLTFAGVGSIFSSNAVQFGPPGLLFAAPRPRNANESIAAYDALVADSGGDTTPYQVIGGAWGKIMDSATRRPRLGCIPSSSWFLHEAGYHLTTGVMALRPPDEAVAGETLVDSLLPDPALAAPTPDDVLMWHPRVWDLHVWLPQTPGDRPTVSIYAPFDVPGARACTNTPDPQCSATVFFLPETFE